MPFQTSSGDQPNIPGQGVEENKGGLATFGIGATAFTTSGFVPYKEGRLWDKYNNFVRAVETGSPSAMLRTFRTSELLSPLESWDYLSVNKEYLKGGKYAEYLKNVFGQTKELHLNKTGSIFGEVTNQKGRLLGYGLNIEGGAQNGTSIADYYARISGIQLTEHESLNEALLRSHYRSINPGIPYSEWLDEIEPHLRRQRLILGAKLRNKISFLGKEIPLSSKISETLAKGETLFNFMRAKSAADTGRLNTLLASPFETPIIGDFLGKIPGIKNLAVSPGTTTHMFSGFIKKGLLIGAAWKGVEYLDYLRSEDSVWSPALSTGTGALIGSSIARKAGTKFSKTGLAIGATIGLATALSSRFDDGLFAGGLSLLTDLDVGRAEVSSSLGLTKALKQQEEITPGLNNISTGLAFGGVGALAFGISSYSSFLFKSVADKDNFSRISDSFESTRSFLKENLLDSLWKTPIGEGVKKVPLIGKLSKIKSPMLAGFILGTAGWAVAKTGLNLLSGNPLAALPGSSLLGTTETPEELQKIYSGEQEVAVKKGRFWEMNSSSLWSGGDVDYYRQHALPRLRARAFDKGIYGSEKEKWEYDPLLNPLDFLFDDDFKYHYEQKNMYSRPAPVSGSLFNDVPFIGPLLSSTIGKLIKPRKFIRPEEWMTGEGSVINSPEGREDLEPFGEIGGLNSGSPVSKQESTQVFNELMYRRREGLGLVGFAESGLASSLLGREELLPNKTTMAEMGKEQGSGYWFWDHLNLGGGLFSTEGVRRFIPRERSYLDSYNPLKNTAMPSWMPEDYFMDYDTGSPMDKIKEAEIRLPGSPGFSALHPELEGVDPENYSLPWKVKVLGDLAHWSPAYKGVLSQAKNQLSSFSRKEQEMVLETERQVKERIGGKEFNDYVSKGNLLQEEEVTISEILSPSKFKTEEYGDLILEAQGVGKVRDQKLLAEKLAEIKGEKVSIYSSSMESKRLSMTSSGGRMSVVPIIGGQDLGEYLSSSGATEEKGLEDEFKQVRMSSTQKLASGLSEELMHGIETPFEYLTPMSPASKLVRHRSPIEDYVRSVAVGTNFASWQNPYSDFVKPFINLSAERLGSRDLPQETIEKRENKEYFDMLEWVKFSRLEAKAENEQNQELASKFRNKKRSTVFGADVFGKKSNILRSLPKEEREYFDAFSNARTAEDRERILELVPENERRIYSSVWLKQEASASLAKVEAKIGTEEDNRILAIAQQSRRSEGFSFQEQQIEQWREETGEKVPFDDWIREQKAEEYFLTHTLPNPDWIGWNPMTDMDDILLKKVEMIAGDYHDYGLLGERKRALARKPYINSQVIDDMERDSSWSDSSAAAKNSTALTRMYNDYDASVRSSKIEANIGRDRYNIEVRDGRKGLIEKAHREMGV